MTPLQIVLLILFSIIGVYLLFIFLDIVFVLVFVNIFKKHHKGIVVNLTTKHDFIRRIIEQLNSLKIPVEFKYIKALQDLDFKNIDLTNNKNIIDCKNTLNFIKEYLFFVIRNNDQASKHREINQLRNELQELDSHYRSLVIMYNSDVLGYNYWIHFFPTRYLWFKAKPKEYIQ